MERSRAARGAGGGKPLPWVRGNGGDGAAPSDAARAPATATGATGARVLLATADPVFAALCKHALETTAGPHPQVVAVSPSELLQAARQIEHDVLVLDADRLEVAALKVLASKV
ncbi:MAG: hypothetical protein QOI66_3367, partial [Myxococcales bacterium]|nr:hypothetical protein [Myxococcales bacterium]